MKQKMLLRFAAFAAVVALGMGAVEAQSARRAIGNLLGYTDGSGNLMVTTVAASGSQSARRAIGNLMGRTDDSGNLMVAVSGDVVSTAANTIGWDGRSELSSPSDGVILMTNAAGTDFNRLQFGGTTSSFPAIKRSSTSLQVRLADDSALTTLQTGALQSDMIGPFTGGKPLFRGTAPTISSGFGTSPTVPANNGSGAFTINVGTGGTATAGVVAMNVSSTTGWICSVNAPAAPTMYSRQTASTTTTVTISNYNSAGTLTAWAASTVLNVSCFGY